MKNSTFEALTSYLSKLNDIRVSELMFERENDFDDCRNVLLPVTRENLKIEKADGFRVKVSNNQESKWVIDAASQVGTNIFGHRYEPLMEEMRNLYQNGGLRPILIDGQGYFHDKQKELAKKLTQIYPGSLSNGDLKTYFCNSGSEAVERGCLKAAQLYKGGSSYVGFEDAFHGRTSLALSHTNSKPSYQEGFDFIADTITGAYPTKTGAGQFDQDPEKNAEEALQELEQKIKEKGPESVNSMLIEPLQGEGGYNIPHPVFMEGLEELSKKHDIPLICDEVQSAIRTGEWFASENFDVKPDMISVAKAFSGGITPFGASMIKDKYATNQKSKHSGTFGGSNKECFIALKTIQLIEQENMLENAQQKGKLMQKRFEELKESSIVHQTRGIGLFQGVEFRKNGEPSRELRDQIMKEMFREHDIMTEACGTKENTAIRFLLPVNVDKQTVEKTMDGLIKSVNKIE